MIKIKIFEDSNLFFEDEFNSAKELTVGRGSTCDIILNPHPGISRSHLKISIFESHVEVNLISKTGKLVQNSQNVSEAHLKAGSHTVSIPPYDFKFEIPEIKAEVVTFESTDISEDQTNKAFSELEVEGIDNSLSIQGEFDSDEKTNAAIASPLEYSIKVFKGSRLLQELSLDGNAWDFGRDQDCHYTIKSKKTSRKHFSILNSRGSFYVKDLGSSNGTFLNAQQLPANQEIEIKSGDYIEVAEFKFIFEIKDNAFEKKVQDVALIEQFGSEVDDSIQDIGLLRESALALSDEMLKLPEKDRMLVQKKSPVQKYMRPVLLILIVAIGGFYFAQNDSASMNTQELASIEEQKRLAREKVNAAVDRFNLALRFYNESQFERCIFEIDEFLKYDVQTEETAGAIELKNQCDIEKERLQRKRDIEIQEEKKREIARKVDDLIVQCSPLAEEGTSALSPCVAPIYDLDPSNEKVAALNDRAETVDMEREQSAADAKKYQASVRAGKHLYNKAYDYDRFGDWKRALKAYRKHIRSKYPDPGGYKKKAKRNIASINTRIQSVLESAITEAQKFSDEDDYKNAILSAKKGLEVNRDHAKLLKVKADAERNLKVILRKYYQDSILEEEYGQIDEAKIKWKKIISQGIKGSDYYNKAKSKLKYYEEGV